MDSELVRRLADKGQYHILLPNDQLIKQKKEKKCFKGFLEGDIKFKPTYKYDPGTDNWDTRYVITCTVGWGGDIWPAQGCALSKIIGSPEGPIYEIWGVQHNVCIKIKFILLPKVKHYSPEAPGHRWSGALLLPVPYSSCFCPIPLWLSPLCAFSIPKYALSQFWKLFPVSPSSQHLAWKSRFPPSLIPPLYCVIILFLYLSVASPWVCLLKDLKSFQLFGWVKVGVHYLSPNFLFLHQLSCSETAEIFSCTLPSTEKLQKRLWLSHRMLERTVYLPLISL